MHCSTAATRAALGEGPRAGLEANHHCRTPPSQVGETEPGAAPGHRDSNRLPSPSRTRNLISPTQTTQEAQRNEPSSGMFPWLTPQAHLTSRAAALGSTHCPLGRNRSITPIQEQQELPRPRGHSARSAHLQHHSAAWRPHSLTDATKHSTKGRTPFPTLSG